MEDSLSRTSTESGNDGFVMVGNHLEPKLQIIDDGGMKELEEHMSEILSCDDVTKTVRQVDSSGNFCDKYYRDENSVSSEYRKSLKAGIDDEETTLFTGMTYLGSAMVNAPRSEIEVNRNMTILNEQSQTVVPITLSVPSHSEGIVYLLDPESGSEIAAYQIHQILFCARGPADSNESRCFAFTCSQGDNAESAIFLCHVFRCQDPDVKVGKILYNFATAFRRVPKSPSSMTTTLSEASQQTFEGDSFHFSVSLDLKELEKKTCNYLACPKDKGVFKLRCNVEKKIYINITQVESRGIKIERCFGMLLTAGRNVKTSDMHLLEVASMAPSSDMKSYAIVADWNPSLPHFSLINSETTKDAVVFMTVAVDVVMDKIREPVRFLLEIKAKLFPSSEKFWYFSNRTHVERFMMKVRESEDQSSGSMLEVVSIENESERERKKQKPMISSMLGVFQNQKSSSPNEPTSPVDESDNDEPLLSGSGIVSKDVTDDSLLESWHEVLIKWHQNVRQRPRAVEGLVRRGVPEALRGEVWQLLAGSTEDHHMFEAYRLLITKESPSEEVIQRDLNRTFPANEFFKDVGGGGQESLYKICKAYSVHDVEINYCQGVSFLTAALLLHMPEEQAFCLLVKIMYDYKLRDLFRQDFEELHLKFYQLERCMEDQLPDLFDHFSDLGLEAHMYASQWFLTLFTAKFPLFVVYHVLDIFISEGMSTIFGIALALLKMSRKELLTLDFEGVLKYFRVQLPKKYRSEEAAREMIMMAVTLKPSPKKLKKYENAFRSFRESQLQQEDPLERLKRENKRLTEGNMRLERENDDLASELVNSKIQLRKELDEIEDRYDIVNKELLLSKSQMLETEEEKKRLEVEVHQLKELCRREAEKSADNDTRNQAIILDYKQICCQLSERIEKMSLLHKKELSEIKKALELCCEPCRKRFDGSEEGCEMGKEGEGVAFILSKARDNPGSEPQKINDLAKAETMIRDLELELAQTKLALVECECKNQDLIHQLTTLTLPSTISTSANGSSVTNKNSWLQKTLTSIKEVTAVKATNYTFSTSKESP